MLESTYRSVDGSCVTLTVAARHGGRTSEILLNDSVVVLFKSSLLKISFCTALLHT